MKISSTRIAAVAVSGALILGGVFASAASAEAATGVLAGTVTLLGQGTGGVAGSPITSGAVTGSGSDSVMFYGFKVTTGCPTGDQGRSDTAVFQNNVRISGIGQARNASVTLYGNTGLDGTPINMTDIPVQPSANPFVNNQPLSNLLATADNPVATPLVAGAFDVRVYCSPTSAQVNYVTDPYFDLPLTLSSDLSTWSVPAAAKTATSVGLTALKNSDTTVSLTATVLKADGVTTATDAIGSCIFYSPAGTQIGTGTVTNGVATFKTAANALGTYSYTAKFVGANDPKYNDSAVSAASTVTFQANTGTTQVTVSIAAGANGGALVLSGVPAAVNLGTATLSGGLLKASAQLGTITVSDTRQDGSAAWNLTGQDTDFTSAAPVHVFDGSYLGWVPALVGSPNAGTAGPTVAPGIGAGLKVNPGLLATGSVVDNQPLTTVGATLNLAVPSQTAAGVYNSTLTITLA